MGSRTSPAAQSGGFELIRASVNSAGKLVLTGTAALPGADSRATAGFVVVGRKSNMEKRFPAVLSGDGQLTEVTAHLPLDGLDLGGDALADVFFVSEARGKEARTRVAWHSGTARWLPYPTKFGNLSLKRK